MGYGMGEALPDEAGAERRAGSGNETNPEPSKPLSGSAKATG